MKSQKLNNKIFKIFILIELTAIVGFILYVYLPVLSEVAATGDSDIPTVSVEAINKVNKILDGRKQLTYPEKPDLSKFEFGKEEPFK